jgi:hypothetical protein
MAPGSTRTRPGSAAFTSTTPLITSLAERAIFAECAARAARAAQSPRTSIASIASIAGGDLIIGNLDTSVADENTKRTAAATAPVSGSPRATAAAAAAAGPSVGQDAPEHGRNISAAAATTTAAAARSPR